MKKKCCHCELRRGEAIPVKRWIASSCFAVLAVLAMTIGCGSGAVIEQINPTPSPEDGTSLNLSPQEQIYVAAAGSTDTVGSIATVGINNPRPIQKKKAVTDGSDVVLKSFDGKLFVINRYGTDTIQVIDPATFKIIGNYSVGSLSNPQDLVVANGKAFITRLDAHLDKKNSDDLLIVNPLTGSKIASIDLKPYTTNDGFRFARAVGMVLVGDDLYVLIQDLGSGLNTFEIFEANTNGKVAVIDTKNNSVSKIIPLTGRNPAGIVYNDVLKKIFITDTGVFISSTNSVDINTPYGGIEVIDTATNTSLGILIDDKDFGGYLDVPIRLLNENVGLVTLGGAIVASFNPTTLQILNKNLYTSSGGYLPDLTIDKNGLLWVPERDLKGSGLILIDPQTGAKIGGPYEVGSLPAAMTLIR